MADDDSSSPAGGSGGSTKQRIAQGLGQMSQRAQQSSQQSDAGASKSREEVERGSEGFRNTVTQRLGTLHKGGKVKRTGDYKLEKGERVLSKRQVKRMKSKRA